MVPPSHFDWFEERLEELHMNVDIHIGDVYEYLAEKEKESVAIARENEERNFNFEGFYRYNEILKYLYNLEETYSNSTIISLEIVQHNYTDGNRPLVYLKINARNDGIANPNKPIVIIEAGINPREWITIPAAVNVINKLLDNEQRRFLDNYEWIVIPVANPDGYEYTHTNLRFWMKNRSTRSSLGSICPGVNINRNFDIEWLTSGSSSSSCSHLYGGVNIFSEPESQMIGSLIDEHGSRIRLYISLQNNGGFVSYPWNYERAATGLFRTHHLLGLQMINAMNEDYKLGVGSIVLERASGTSVDYARSKSITYSYNIDIVQHEEDSFEIPAADIVDVVEDVWRAVSVAADNVFVEE
ncbi:carboxypeptidase B-like [Aphomia sociella]